jgi:hypothetical protein
MSRHHQQLPPTGQQGWPQQRPGGLSRGAKQAMLIVGLALTLAGGLLGFLPRSAGGVSCGSAFVGSRAPAVADLTAAIEADSLGVALGDRIGEYATRCADRRSSARILAVVPLALGGVLLAGLGVVYIIESAPPADPVT